MDNMIPLDLNGKILPLTSDANRHFSYIRYNADLSRKGLENLGISDIDSDDIRDMDAVKNIKQLREVGRAAGKKQVSIEHFASFLPASIIVWFKLS